MEISLSAEKIFSIGSFEITNAVFTASLVVIILCAIAVIIGSGISLKKPSKMQLLFEMIVGGLYNMAKDVMGAHSAAKYFPFLFTFFTFILLSNWFGLLPFVSSVGFIEDTKGEVHAEEKAAEEEHSSTDEKVETETEVKENCSIANKDCVLNVNEGKVESQEHLKHIFRAPTSDLSMTLALALLSVVFTNIFAIKEKGLFGFIGNYFHSFAPIDLIVGLFEIVSEVGKIISFSFRLFGNVFAGEVLLAVLTDLAFGAVTLPFLGLEFFIGAVQAFVFMMLTMVFMSIAVTPKAH